MAQLKLSRFLNASRARVFAAWTKPNTLGKWFVPGGTVQTKVDLDFRVDDTTPFHLTIGLYREPFRRSCRMSIWFLPGSGLVTMF